MSFQLKLVRNDVILKKIKNINFGFIVKPDIIYESPSVLLLAYNYDHRSLEDIIKILQHHASNIHLIHLAAQIVCGIRELSKSN